ncbi:hypothetical protein D0864_05453 [Hortaea werneckii]|uniref:Uncharacterized protein n=1 Tax=Hortaea werneckii TaxID=91943 RepID=A0A3M7G0Y9_HORWE|nr:hypothetical protein D0864_05453 [Hortaea werneckii]
MESFSRDLPMPSVSRITSLNQAHATLLHCCNKLGRFEQCCQPQTSTPSSPVLQNTQAEERRAFRQWLQRWESAFSQFLSTYASGMSSEDLSQCRILKANHIACNIVASNARPGTLEFDANLTIINNNQIRAIFKQQPLAFHLSRGRDNKNAMTLRGRRRRKPHTRRTTPNQKRFSSLHLQSIKHAPVRRLQHLPTRPKNLPGQTTHDLLAPLRPHAAELRVGPVELPPHPAQRRDDNIPLRKLPARRRLHKSRRFDPEDPREGDGTVALAGEELGAVEPDGFDADQDPAGTCGWEWAVFEL